MKLSLQHFERDEILGLFCDTQFEHPTTYEHVDWIEMLYGVAIHRISTGDVLTRCLRYERFPSGAARFCTDDLKIRPSKWFYENLAAKQGVGFEVWYGMRSDESPERERRYRGKIDTQLYAPHEVLPKKYPEHLARMGVMFKLPVLEWSTSEVFEFLNGEENPLYEHFDRVGCFPCLAAGDKYKRKAFEHDEVGRAHHAQVIAVEGRIGKRVFTSKRENGPGCAVCSI